MCVCASRPTHVLGLCVGSLAACLVKFGFGFHVLPVVQAANRLASANS